MLRPSSVACRMVTGSLMRSRCAAGQWSASRSPPAKRLGVHHMMVARVWKKNGIQPHRMERYMASNDPDFEKKAADVIGLYLRPPQHAAVFSVDEKTAIQALEAG